MMESDVAVGMVGGTNRGAEHDHEAWPVPLGFRHVEYEVDMTGPPWKKLQDALGFLVERLEAEDYAAIGAVCPKLRATGESSYGYHALAVLRQKHLEKPLLSLYRLHRFPWLRRRYKLGGHDRELGHVHIDFSRTPAGWELDHINICR